MALSRRRPIPHTSPSRAATFSHEPSRAATFSTREPQPRSSSPLHSSVVRHQHHPRAALMTPFPRAREARRGSPTTPISFDGRAPPPPLTPAAAAAREDRGGGGLVSRVSVPGVTRVCDPGGEGRGGESGPVCRCSFHFPHSLMEIALQKSIRKGN